MNQKLGRERERTGDRVEGKGNREGIELGENGGGHVLERGERKKSRGDGGEQREGEAS